MTKTPNSETAILTTSETDVYVAPSKAVTLLIQLVNTSGSAVTCELWLTDASNTKLACLLPSQSITAGSGTSDTAKHTILNGYKIRGLASTGSVVYVEVSVFEGM